MRRMRKNCEAGGKKEDERERGRGREGRREREMFDGPRGAACAGQSMR